MVHIQYIMHVLNKILFLLISYMKNIHIEFNLNQMDSFENTAIGLLFWQMAVKHQFQKNKLVY